MKIEKLFFGLMGLMVVLFILSITIWKNETIDVHLHDTYFVISSAFIVKIGLFLLLINFLLYKIMGRKEGRMGDSILVLHLILFLISLILISGFGFKLRYIDYTQSSLFIWAFFALVFSELLIGIYYFLPGRKMST